MEIRIFIALCVLLISSEACLRQPKPGLARVERIRGDNDYRIGINDNGETYTAGHVYTVTISSINQKRFTRFILTSENEEDNDSPQKRGTFQLFGDVLTTFDEQCVNTVSEKNHAAKRGIEVMWTAPPSGSGCVVLKAMVFEDRYHWYADDGQLSRKLCEKEETVSLDECCACDEAKYSFIFEGIWSNITHPRDFPFSLWLTHFSDVVGASHESNFSFWGEGHIATDGFRSLAEWGSPRLLDQELRLKSKHLRSVIRAAGLWYPKVNTNTSSTFKVDRKRHLISLVSMLGPSPDWVVGVNGLELCQKDCTWKEKLTIDLYPWDAGTDSGISYMSPNAETKPRERMYPITTKYPEDPRAPFYDPTKDEMLPLAKLYLKREKVIPKNCDDKFLTSQIEITENTEDNTRPECGVTEWTAWSPCSVSCGKGLSMRTREYLIPAKAQMLNCDRQLVSKEMCVAAIPECAGNTETEASEEAPVFEAIPEGICTVSPWSEWSTCSETCGKGIQMRNRHFVDRMGFKKCPHISLVEKEPCMISTECTVTPQDPECPVTEWTDWSPCSITCGGKGIILRTRFLIAAPEKQRECASKTELIQQQTCGQPECPKLTMEAVKGICMQPAETGPCRGFYNRWYFEQNKLMCVPFVYGGCRGNENNFLSEDDCNNLCQTLRNALTGESAQPVDCVLSDWGPWGECNQPCGPGRASRTREILVKPENGGKPCPKRMIKWRRCQGVTCN